MAVLVAGTLTIGASGLLFVALEWTSGGVAAIVFSAIPLLAVLVEWFLLPDERPTGRGLLGIGVGFVELLLGFVLLENRALVAELANYRGAAR